MFCPSFKHENRDGQKFSAQCGVELALVSRSCAARNQPAMRFCDECGRNLADPPQALAQRAPRSCAPPHLACRIPCQGGGDGTERCGRQRVQDHYRSFADIKGSFGKSRPSTTLLLRAMSIF